MSKKTTKIILMTLCVLLISTNAQAGTFGGYRYC